MGKLRHGKVMQVVQSLGPLRDSSVRPEPGLWTPCPVLSSHKRFMMGPNTAEFLPYCSTPPALIYPLKCQLLQLLWK